MLRLIGGVNPTNGQKLNGSLIQRFFKEKLDEYCTVVLGEETCSLKEERGCGINSKCPNEKTCIAADNEFGFQCVGKVITQKKRNSII